MGRARCSIGLIGANAVHCSSPLQQIICHLSNHMSSRPQKSLKAELFSLPAEAVDQLFHSQGWPKFRGTQVRDWVYRKSVTDPQQMTNLSKAARNELAELMGIETSTSILRQDSNDGTLKLLISWSGPTNAETVMIPDADRRTACVSSQVGCPVGCRFCASGVNGVKGNLTVSQIVEQVAALNRIMREQAPDASDPPRIGNIVFMGMGEPLANYANVMQAIRILHDPGCFNISARKITISTVGVPPRMRELAHEDLPLNLAISLHAPNEKLRRQLIPWAEHFSIGEILEAARYYFDKTGREITLEYILLSGVNDQPEHASELAKVCKTLRANVNLIRYNEVSGLDFKRPHADDVLTFQRILRNNGVNTHVRKSRGRDIDAACGQLRRKQQDATPVQLGGEKAQ